MSICVLLVTLGPSVTKLLIGKCLMTMQGWTRLASWTMYDALSIAAFDSISCCLRGWPLMLTAAVPLVPCKEFAVSEGCGSWRFLSCQQLLRDASSSLESFVRCAPGGSEISFVLRCPLLNSDVNVPAMKAWEAQDCNRPWNNRLESISQPRGHCWIARPRPPNWPSFDSHYGTRVEMRFGASSWFRHGPVESCCWKQSSGKGTPAKCLK